jgi:anti-sigma factor RsiW
MRLGFRTHPVEEDIIALLDGELPLPERVTVERHLAGCERCADLYARNERARRALAFELAVDPETNPAALHWKLHPAATAAGAGVLTASIGALVVAGLLMRRHSHHRRAGVLRTLGAV